MELYVDWDNQETFTEEEHYEEAIKFVSNNLEVFINDKFTAFELYKMLPAEIQEEIREECLADYLSEPIIDLDVVTIKI